MPRVCTVCSHGDRPAINAAPVAGEPKRAIAARFGLSESAVKRHAAEHLPATLLKAAQAAEVADAEALLDQVNAIGRRARADETQAASASDVRAALLALREERATAALAARMTGRLDGAAAPAEPFRPIRWTSFDPETGEEVVINPWEVFPDVPPPPDRRKIIADHLKATAAARDERAAPEANGNGHAPHGEPATTPQRADT